MITLLKAYEEFPEVKINRINGATKKKNQNITYEKEATDPSNKQKLIYQSNRTNNLIRSQKKQKQRLTPNVTKSKDAQF